MPVIDQRKKISRAHNLTSLRVYYEPVRTYLVAWQLANVCVLIVANIAPCEVGRVDAQELFPRRSLIL